MKRVRLSKGLVFFVAMASQLCLPSFLREAAASTNFITAHVKDFVSVSSMANKPPAIHFYSDKKRLAKIRAAFTDELTKQTYTDKDGNPKATSESAGWCALKVRLAFEKIGIKYKQEGQAKNVGTSLEEAGFIKVPSKKANPMTGLTGIVGEVKKFHPDGHIGAYTNHNKWKSDFEQKGQGVYGVWPYEQQLDKSLISFYIHPTFIDHSGYRFSNAAYLMSGSFSRPALAADYAPKQVQGLLSHIDEKTTKWQFELAAQTEKAFSAFVASLAGPSVPFTQNTASLGPQPSIDAGFGIAKAAPSTSHSGTLYPPIPVRNKSKKHDEVDPLKTLQAEWHEARKAVLKRNASLKIGTLDQIAHMTLRRSVMNMSACLPYAMEKDVVTGFKAARYIFNKTDIIGGPNAKIDKTQILETIADKIDIIAQINPKLATEARNFVIKNAGKGPLRDSMRRTTKIDQKLTA